jgi:hypothetical protein
MFWDTTKDAKSGRQLWHIDNFIHFLAFFLIFIYFTNKVKSFFINPKWNTPTHLWAIHCLFLKKYNLNKMSNTIKQLYELSKCLIVFGQLHNPNSLGSIINQDFLFSDPFSIQQTLFLWLLNSSTVHLVSRIYYTEQFCLAPNLLKNLT